ncbi:UdgX family uracil-DNA binding protein [uncultured Sulfitobacter sp.]|uniref:UdgX family uracil-DNA binding protein n=1 Tax=uncultured Sulfitobacter sp. TaxID=191468 RepID=UPI002626662C|nr:UdgX family uracil-DNA binding protein [uncultured Sulfitobacter sp.]
MIYAPRLPRIGTFDAWRDAARALASNDVPPDQIDWAMQDSDAGLFGASGAPLPSARDMTVPKAFIPLARQVCASRTAGAHDLLYRVLLRSRGAPRLLSNRADPQVQRLEEIGKNIRRDMHKMKAFVRFREVTEQGANRRSFLSWFEPDHRIEELIGGFFTRRFADMDWAIVTPEVTMRFAAGDLSVKAVQSARLDLSDETEALWKTYYANIFNPARLKIKAMQSEMPKKYWKNLPEAELIPELIANAEAQVRVMQEQAQSQPPPRAAKVLDRLPLREMPCALASCARCPLGAKATQAVAGEGPRDAPLMIVGEQPGDYEDLAGRPFVGPAGQLFDTLALEAGLDRRAAYVTNAVKHFKFTPRGKRRIHQSPHRSEVEACRIWLAEEIEQIRPALIVAMGATAAQALTGSGTDVLKRAGRVEEGTDGLPVLVTVHPSAILRASNGSALRARLIGDLKQAVEMCDRIAALPPDR